MVPSDIYDKPLVRLLAEKPRIFWGKVIATLLKQGWRPPSPNEKITDELIKAIDSIMEVGGASYLIKSNTTLTKRQTEVLVLVSHGHSREEIGKGLGMSEGTAKWHMTEVFEKLEAKNAAHAVAIALRNELID